MEQLPIPVCDRPNHFLLSKKQNAASNKLRSLYKLLDELGWFIASENPNNPDFFALRRRTLAFFNKNQLSRIELDTYLFTIDSKNILYRSKNLIIWREPKKHNQIPVTNTLLTKRECEVNELLLAGFTLSDMATELGISQRTVEKHVENLYRKRGVNSYNELIFGKPSH